MRRFIPILLILTILVSPVIAQAECESILIDNFENETVDSRYENFNTVPIMELTTTSVSGQAFNITLEPDQYMNLLKQYLNTDMPMPFEYYNISLWYHKVSGTSECDGGDYGIFRITANVGEIDDDNPDGQWKMNMYYLEGFGARDPMKTCNEWHHFNRALDDFDNENGFNLSAYHFGSFGFEIQKNPDTTVIFDEIKLIPKTPCCEENWQCGPWTDCTPDGYQTRDCLDLNECGTTYNKSSEIQNCTYSHPIPGCDPEWRCYDWGECVNDIQSRTCYDIHSCNTLSGQPQTSRPCVTPTLSISATSDSSFERTDTITVTGNVTDEFGSLKSSDVTMTLTSGSFSKTYQQLGVSEFDFSYTILQSDPIGTWTIEINATDGTNVGFWEYDVSVFEASAFDTYNVVFTSPDEGTPYARGENVNIMVRVEQGETEIEDADVFIFISDQRMNLTETTSGTYHTIYKIPYNIPLGTLPISVRAEKDGATGTSTANIYVLPANLNVVMSSAGDGSVGISQTVSANVSYPDGTPTSGLDLIITTSDGIVQFTEVSPGIYSASFTPTSLGIWDLGLDIKDAYSNIGSRSTVVNVGEVTIFDLLIQYWYFIVIGVIAVALIYWPLSKRRAKSSRYDDLVKEGQRIIKMQEEVQKAYFELNEIDLETFKKKSAEYEKRLTEIREEVEKLKPGKVG